MLNYLLVWIVSLGSVGLYLSRFFLPEVQRKNDWIWSIVGLFYALILLADGDRIRGGLLLGQMASVSLIVWFGWQTLQQRRQLAPLQDQTALPESVDGILPFVKTGWGRLVESYKDGTLLDSEDPTDTTDSPKKSFKIGEFSIPTDLTKIFSVGSNTEEKRTVSSSVESENQASSPAIDDDWEEETVATSDLLPSKEPDSGTAETIHENAVSENSATMVSSDPVTEESETHESIEEQSVQPTTESEAEATEDVIVPVESHPSTDNLESQAVEAIAESVPEVKEGVIATEPQSSSVESEEHPSQTEHTTINESPEALVEENPEEQSKTEISLSPATDAGADWPPEDPVT